MILFDLNRTLPIKIYIKINLFYVIIMNIIRGLSLIMGQQAELYICVYIYMRSNSRFTKLISSYCF